MISLAAIFIGGIAIMGILALTGLFDHLAEWLLREVPGPLPLRPGRPAAEPGEPLAQQPCPEYCDLRLSADGAPRSGCQCERPCGANWCPRRPHPHAASGAAA